MYEYCEVKDQHNRKDYYLKLPNGNYVISIISDIGEAILNDSFTIEGEHWAAIDYWFYPEDHYWPTPKHFSFFIQDEPISWGK